MPNNNNPSGFFETQANRTMRLLGRKFAEIPDLTTTSIAHVQTDNDGRPVYAITAEGYRVDISIGTPIKEGDEWIIRGEGGAAGRQWYAVARVNTTSDLLGPMENRWIPMPIVPIQAFGGWSTVEEGSSLVNPGGVPRAQVTIYPRTIVQGLAYDIYGQHFPNIVWRERRLGADLWNRTIATPIEPTTAIDIALMATVGGASPTVWTISTNPENANQIPQNQLLYWIIEDETVIASLSGNALTIHTRGADGTLITGHTAGSLIRLASGKLTINTLDPGVTYEIGLAFQDAFNATGPFGDPIEVVTWQQATRPAAPTGISVKIDNGNYHVKWNPVPDASVDSYHIYRYDGVLPPDGNLAPPNPHTDLGYVRATTALVPVAGVNTGTGNNFGIAAKNTSGLESTISWSNDTWVPSSPNFAQVEIVSAVGGIVARVLDLAPMAFSGFRNFALWQASDAAGTGQAMIFRFPKGAVEQFFPIADYNILHTYQVTSQAYNENLSTPVATAGAWQWAASLQPLPGSPPNGNFEIPNAAADAPAGWILNDAGDYNWQYSVQGGIRGSSSCQLIAMVTNPAIPGGGNTPKLRANSAYRQVFNWRRPTVVEFWIRNPSGATTSPAICTIGFSAERYASSSDYGLGLFVGPLTSIGVSDWEKVTVSILANQITFRTPIPDDQPMRYYWFDEIYWFYTAITAGQSILIDDVVLYQT